jgi:uncharacterized membrane protein YjjB (DUF3815 family)
MLVPGPHLINGLLDTLQNHLQTGICRLMLAAGILLSAAAGALGGGAAVLDLQVLTGATSEGLRLTLLLDMALAAVASCGFGAFYNAPWRVLWISIFCGMIGHGARFICLGLAFSLPTATFIACLVIGVLAGFAVIRPRLPFSSVAFAAAVPMMPGTLIYRSIRAGVDLSWGGSPEAGVQLTAMMVPLLQSLVVVGALVFGLLLGDLAATWTYEHMRATRERAEGESVEKHPEPR